MLFVKYIVLSLLFLFKGEIEPLNIGIFLIFSLTLTFIVEINKNEELNNILIILYGIFIYYNPNSRYFIFPFIYSIYKITYYNIPISLLFLYFEEYDFFVLSLAIIIFSVMERFYLQLEMRMYNDFINFHKTKYTLNKSLKKLHSEEERHQHELILKEREEISKNLHNSIGHTLSASIIELHALSLICDDEDMKKSLEGLKDNLSVGMIEIREIIHNMHKSSFDLENSILKLLDIQGKDTHLVYKVKSNLSGNFVFDIVNIVKECLTNFLKYSNGDSFNVRFIENERLYILTIWDNGTDIDLGGDGLGLISIKQITEKYFGTFNIITENGFRINMTFGKE